MILLQLGVSSNLIQAYDVGTEEQRPFAIKVGFQETLKVLGILDSGITVSVMLGSELKSGPYMLLLYVGGGCIYGAAEGSYREDSDPAD